MAGIENVWNGLGYTQHEAIPTAGDSAASPASDHGVERSSFPQESSPKGNAGILDLDSSWNPLRLMPPPDSLIRHRVVDRLRPAQRSSLTDRMDDLTSITAGSDEGYHSLSTATHNGSRSVFGSDMSQRFLDPDHRLDGLSYEPFHISIEEPVADYSIQPQPPHNSLRCEREGCNHESRTQSEYRRHESRHNKEHVCKVPDCSRTEGFASLHDLMRHQKSVHKIWPQHGQRKEYKCFGESCAKPDKEWPRLDNFKQHLRRMHTHENAETLITKSNEWYEQHKQTKIVTRAGSLSSSSSSWQATAQHPVPKKRNRRGTTDQAQVGNSVPLKRIPDLVFEGVGDNGFDNSGIILEDDDTEMLTSESIMRSEQHIGSKALPPIPEAEDVPSVNIARIRAETLYMYHSTPLELQSPFETLKNEKPEMGKARLNPPTQSNPGQLALGSEHVVHSPPSDDKEQHSNSKEGLLLSRNLQAISATEETVSEHGTNDSALESTKSDCGLETAPNPSLSPLPSRLEEFEDNTNTNTCRVLPTAKSSDLFLPRFGTDSVLHSSPRDKSSQPQIELRSQTAQLQLQALREEVHNEESTFFATNSETTKNPNQDGLCDRESPALSATEFNSEISSIGSMTDEGQAIELPAEVVRLQETFVLQLIREYVSSWRSSNGQVRSRPGQRPTSTSGQERHLRQHKSRGSAPSAKSLGKRRRQADQDPDDFPSSDDDNKRPRLNSEGGDSNSKLFACPYAKYDPMRYSERNGIERNYRGCSSRLLRNIARLKQHLDRVHMRPEQYCPRCGKEFECQDLQEEHTRETTPCAVQELPFKEKMTKEQKDAVHKRSSGKCAREVWYEIFGIIFPDAPEPSSPYIDTGAPEAVQDFLGFFQERAPPMLRRLILQSTLQLGWYEQMMLDTAVETAIPRLVEEFGRDFHLSSEGNPRAASNTELAADASITASAVPEITNPPLQQIEAGPNMTRYSETSPNMANFDSQQLTQQFTGFSEWPFGRPYIRDDETYSPNLGSIILAGSNNWNAAQQTQITMPDPLWQHGAWIQPTGQRLQQVAEGA